LIKGVETIDISELEESARYIGCQKNDQHIKWFWDILKEYSVEESKKFLFFVTGSDRSPLRGLKQLNFEIHSTALDDLRIPSAHTCFNSLILPRYSKKEIMQKKLLSAIDHREGFGLI
jgi:ubiquitin-protein ligase E3 A